MMIKTRNSSNAQIPELFANGYYHTLQMLNKAENKGEKSKWRTEKTLNSSGNVINCTEIILRMNQLKTPCLQ